MKKQKEEKKIKNCNGGKPELENLSKGARLKYIRELRYLKKDYVADYFELGGERKKEL